MKKDEVLIIDEINDDVTLSQVPLKYFDEVLKANIVLFIDKSHNSHLVRNRYGDSGYGDKINLINQNKWDVVKIKEDMWYIINDRELVKIKITEVTKKTVLYIAPFNTPPYKRRMLIGDFINAVVEEL